MEFDVYRIKIAEDDDSGMKAMSIVDRPAIESNFLKLAKQEKQAVIALKDEKGQYKQILAGLALVPNKLIYRVQDEYEYFVFFNSEDIEVLRNKFHKDKYTDLVNLQHSESNIKAYLIESYIINSEERLAEVKAQGIEDAIMGSWYVQYKIEDKEVFEQALEKNLNGFSIEVKGNYEYDKTLALNKNNFKNKNYIMGKFNKLINKFKEVLAQFEEVTATIADTDTQIIYGEVGEPVHMLVAGEEGTEPTRELMSAGEYILDDGKMIVVDENGNLSDIKENEEAPAEAINDEQLEEPIAEPEIAEPEITEDIAIIESILPHEEGGEIVDGSYVIEVTVDGGVITEGTIDSEIHKELVLAKQEIVNLKSEVEQLKKEPMVKPLRINETSKLSKLSKEEIKKMNNLELVKHKLGLD